MPDEQNPDDDKFRPEAIAARIDQIGDETDADRVAREEEQKLLLRRKQQKKTGLQAAASKRLSKIGEASVKRPTAVGAVAPSDPLLDRAARAGQWIREHNATFASIVAVAVVGAGGAFGWTFWQNKRNVDASVFLAQAFADEHGHVAAKDADDDDDSTAKPLYPSFKSAADRREAALSKYRSIESKFDGTGAATLARLGEGSLLLDAGEASGALRAYGDVKGSPLARADAEVRGRALEGIGFADELLAETDGGAKDKHLDDAMAAFKALEGVDTMGFKELGMYHQARVLAARGDKDKATELLKALEKRIAETEVSHTFSYLQFVVEDRLRDLDPSALPPKASKTSPTKVGGGAAGSNIDMNDPKIQELLRQIQQKQGGGATPGGPPGSPE